MTGPGWARVALAGVILIGTAVGAWLLVRREGGAGAGPERIELPDELREISGITVGPDGRLVAVQDELGVLFFLDLADRRSPRTTRVPFGEPGDYEDVVAVDDDYWVLRSDGRLFCVQVRGGRGVVSRRVSLPVAGEFEALAHDAGNRRLLVLPKARLAKKARRKVGADHPVFGVDLRAGGELIAQPLLDLPVRDWQSRLPGLDARITAAVRIPLTPDLLVLLGSDRMVLRLDAAGRLLDSFELPAGMPQAEAMTLTPSGRLLVTSEGQDGPARLVDLGPYR
ncbi:MAG: hypothetical protein NXI31_14290 [bacterium]|nr:hypothetical protein [bacterium]